ncbi:MAG TPA: hypothetical protein VNA69_15165 [Thermoanaerobaculia bacterium]|nr:hypothetical protein [Thermoanaerobaculia bacterium]
MSADYFLEIEAHFALRRGTPFVLSAKDWALMKKWADDGIPLAVLIEAIDTVFDKAAERNKTVNSLSYCRHAVKDLWSERQQLQVGADAATPEAEVEATLDALAVALADRFPAFAVRVRELAAERSVPRIEERLIELEHELVSALVTEDIRAEASRAVSGTLDDATRARTEEAYVRRLVREKHDLPRLTLFR